MRRLCVHLYRKWEGRVVEDLLYKLESFATRWGMNELAQSIKDKRVERWYKRI